MKLFPQVLLLLISLFILNSCSVTKNYSRVKKPDKQVIAVLSSGYTTALYKTSIDIGSNHFSGLFYFKKLDEEKYRIVFMSELGLNLLEFEYDKGSFTTINVQEFLNKKALLNTLQNDLKLLIQSPADSEKQKIFEHKSNPQVLIKIKSNSKRCYYFYNPNNELENMVQKTAFNKVEFGIFKTTQTVPEKIEIHHKIMDIHIDLNLIKVK
jgi:hypothetical protein